MVLTPARRVAGLQACEPSLAEKGYLPASWDGARGFQVSAALPGLSALTISDSLFGTVCQNKGGALFPLPLTVPVLEGAGVQPLAVTGLNFLTVKWG